MPMKFEEPVRQPKPHRIVMDDRHLLSITGVLDVDNFDDGKIEAKTEQGDMIIEGSELHIVRLMVESGELVVEGNIGGIAYINEVGEQRSSGGFLGRLFK